MLRKNKDILRKKKAKKKVSPSDWPDKREILFRPQRLPYVRKLIKNEGCVFCSAVQKGVGFESLILEKGPWVFLILNKYPYNTGHLMVLPNRHCGDLSELSATEQLDLHSLLVKGVKIIQNTYKCPGINIGMNMGVVAGAGYPGHLHYHIIPRWPHDSNFFPLIAGTKVIIETLQTTYERLVPQLSEERWKK